LQAEILDSIRHVALQEAGLLAPFRCERRRISAELESQDGYGTAGWIVWCSRGPQTHAVRRIRRREDVRRLLDPEAEGRWRGTASMAGDFGFVANILTNHGRGPRAMDYLREMARSRSSMSMTLARRARSGHRRRILDQPAAFKPSHRDIRGKGAPSDWLKIEPAPVTLDAVGLVQG